jgi:hypothetical protein
VLVVLTLMVGLLLSMRILVQHIVFILSGVLASLLFLLARLTLIICLLQVAAAAATMTVGTILAVAEVQGV